VTFSCPAKTPVILSEASCGLIARGAVEGSATRFVPVGSFPFLPGPPAFSAFTSVDIEPVERRQNSEKRLKRSKAQRLGAPLRDPSTPLRTMGLCCTSLRLTQSFFVRADGAPDPQRDENKNLFPSGSRNMALVPQLSLVGCFSSSTPLASSSAAVATTSSHQNVNG
jgi:hypothetical protein